MNTRHHIIKSDAPIQASAFHCYMNILHTRSVSETLALRIGPSFYPVVCNCFSSKFWSRVSGHLLQQTNFRIIKPWIDMSALLWTINSKYFPLSGNRKLFAFLPPETIQVLFPLPILVLSKAFHHYRNFSNLSVEFCSMNSIVSGDYYRRQSVMDLP
jgi:hypothetical protein